MPPTDGATPTIPDTPAPPAPHTCCCSGLRGGYILLPLPGMRDVLALAVGLCALAILLPVARERLGA
ncbi:uncharacterized protein COLE_07448 [Cutaneotrichosporon oleaginosum]|nr:hypothetical protein COLE_07448 [Cutaneotrichosporon oleaginosum]